VSCNIDKLPLRRLTWDWSSKNHTKAENEDDREEEEEHPVLVWIDPHVAVSVSKISGR